MRIWTPLTAALLAAIFVIPVHAEDASFDIGIQLNGLGGSGKPTNDILGFGVSGRYRLNRKWWLGVGVDRSDEFDVERPALLLALPTDLRACDVDAKGTSTLLTVRIERVYERAGKLEWFWGVGAGVNAVDIDPASGPLEGGGSYRIVTDAGDEIVLSGRMGLRLRFARRFAFEVALRGDQHLADWKLRDEVSSAAAVIDDYFIRGLTLGLRVRF